MAAVHSATTQARQHATTVRKSAPSAHDVMNGSITSDVKALQRNMTEAWRRFSSDKVAGLADLNACLVTAQKLGCRVARILEGRILGYIGLAYFQLRQPCVTVERYKQAVAIARQTEDRSGETWYLTSLGNTYAMMKSHKLALESYKHALIAGQESADASSQIAVHTNIGRQYHFLGQFDQSIEFLQQALTIAQKHGHVHDQQKLGAELGNLYFDGGHHQHAITYYIQVLDLPRVPKDEATVSNTLLLLGVAYQKLEQWPRSIECGRKAMAIARGLGDSVLCETAGKLITMAQTKMAAAPAANLAAQATAVEEGGAETEQEGQTKRKFTASSDSCSNSSHERSQSEPSILVEPPLQRPRHCESAVEPQEQMQQGPTADQSCGDEAVRSAQVR